MLSKGFLNENERPFSFVGTFYHSHKNEEKFNRNEDGSHWKKYQPQRRKKERQAKCREERKLEKMQKNNMEN